MTAGDEGPGRRAAPLLDVDGLVRLLVEAGIVGSDAMGTALAGGVSNTVVLVEDGAHRVVAKQSLPALKVADHWPADQARILTEADALRVAGAVVPGSVPAVLHVDPERFVVAIEAAPPGWRTWKADLLAGAVDLDVAGAVGARAGAWHAATAADRAVEARFGDPTRLDQLRLDPYYRTVARRVPAVAAAVTALVEATLATRTCLVHGDLSPKNVLVGDGRSWVLDWEVAHVGDPAFDLGFATSHLALKAIHTGRPQSMREASEALWGSYRAARGTALDEARTIAHLGALLLARVHGKSPVEYLDEDGRGRAAAHGTMLLLDPPRTLAEAFP